MPKAMIFAAGLGTRFKPWTDHHPKPLAIVNGKTLLERTIRYLQDFGIYEVIINIHHFGDQVIDTVVSENGWGSQVTISDERDELLETGGGLKKAAGYFENGPFAVINSDILTDLRLDEMMIFHYTHQPLATLAVTNRTTNRYFLFDEKDELCGWTNVSTGEIKGKYREFTEEQKKKVTQKAFSGIHFIDPAIFSMITRQGKFSMVDVYLELSYKNRIKAFDHSGSLLVDVGRTESLREAARLFH